MRRIILTIMLASLALLLRDGASRAQGRQFTSYQLFARQIEFDMASNTFVATGSPRLQGPDLNLQAARMSLVLDKSGKDIRTMTASGGVSLALSNGAQATTSITSQTADLDTAAQVAVMHGGVRVHMVDPAGVTTDLHSETVTYNIKDRTIDAAGAPRIKRGDSTLTSTKMRATLDEKGRSIGSLTADGDVRVATLYREKPDAPVRPVTATAAHATYEAAAARIVLTGKAHAEFSGTEKVKTATLDGDKIIITLEPTMKVVVVSADGAPPTRLEVTTTAEQTPAKQRKTQ